MSKRRTSVRAPGSPRRKWSTAAHMSEPDDQESETGGLFVPNVDLDWPPYSLRPCLTK